VAAAAMIALLLVPVAHIARLWMLADADGWFSLG
jgi:hypothetical protein